MGLSSRILILAAPLLGSFLSTIVTASPVDYSENLGHSDNTFIVKRQAADPSNIDPEDETDAEIAADGTGPLRKAINARSVYLSDQPTATWYQIDVGPSDAAASFTSFVDTTTTPIPRPDDPKQISGPNPWNVDHIFELQVIGEAFKADRPTNNPTSIAAADWTSVSKAVFTDSPGCTAIARDVTVLQNLEGIPSAVNQFKKQVFTGNLTGVGYPGTGNGATYYSFFGPAVQRYLEGNKANFFSTNGIVDHLGDTLSSIGNDNAAVKTYFTNYASLHYQGAIDFLSTWSGKSFDRTSATSTSGTATHTSSASGAAVTCIHEADPDNTCPAIADSPGYCECNNDDKTYAIMNGQNPCGWTTLPRTTSFNCASTTPPPAPAPITTSKKLACTLTDQVIGGGRDPEITHICSCNDGSSPSPTVSGDEYVCPAQVSVVPKKNKRSEFNGIELGGFR